RPLPPRPRQALPAHGQAGGGAGAPHDRDDDVPRYGHGILAGAGGGGDEGVDMSIAALIAILGLQSLARFFGIIIRMFAELAAPHHRPHFHAYYQDAVGIYAIDPI